MASTTFVDGTTVIFASWLNDVNSVVYNGNFSFAPSYSFTGPVTITGATTHNGALTVTGQSNLGGTAGTESLRVPSVSSAVNRIAINGATTTNPPSIASDGSDTNVSMIYATKGTGQFLFRTGSTTTNTQFAINHVASAVNFAQVTGSATGTPVRYTATGTDTNIGNVYETKGTGTHDFNTNSAKQFGVDGVASAVNFLQVGGAIATGTPFVNALGTDTNIGINLVPKGTGSIQMGGTTVINTSKMPVTSSFTTGSLPSAATSGTGAIVRDSTTNSIKFSDGSNWNSVNSGMVFLQEVIPAAGTNQGALNVFSSLYDDYLIEFNNLGNAGVSSALSMRLAVAGAVDSGGNYNYAGNESSTTANTFFGTTTATLAGLTSASITNATDSRVSGWVRITGVNTATAQAKQWTAQVCSMNAGAPLNTTSSGAHAPANVATGIVFTFGGANFKVQGYIRIYGIRKTI